jgi:hypothetical protein
MSVMGSAPWTAKLLGENERLAAAIAQAAREIQVKSAPAFGEYSVFVLHCGEGRVILR